MYEAFYSIKRDGKLVIEIKLEGYEDPKTVIDDISVFQNLADQILNGEAAPLPNGE